MDAENRGAAAGGGGLWGKAPFLAFWIKLSILDNNSFFFVS
jgi:hypothetical protein